MEYQLHPLCTLFPRMDEDVFAAFKEDIKKNGLRTPITLYDGMILDGGHRYRACTELGIRPLFEKYVGKEIGSFVITSNYHRRDLTPAQRAMAISLIQKWEETHQIGENQHTKRVVTDNHPKEKTTTKSRAKTSGVSKSTQKKADAVAKADPELAVKVARGEVSLNEATRQVAPQLVNKKSKPVEVSGLDAEIAIIAAEHGEDTTSEREMWDASLRAMSDEITELKDKLAASEPLAPATDELIRGIRKELKTSLAMVEALTVARDTLMMENTQLKRQVERQSKELKKLRGAQDEPKK